MIHVDVATFVRQRQALVQGEVLDRIGIENSNKLSSPIRAL